MKYLQGNLKYLTFNILTLNEKKTQKANFCWVSYTKIMINVLYPIAFIYKIFKEPSWFSDF